MTLRVETPDDFAGVRRVHEQAFGRRQEADLVDAIRLSPGFVPELSLVAERDEQIVGHALFSLAYVADGDRKTEVLTLAPVGVLPTHQRQGVGSRLIERGLEWARELGFRSVIVLGHPTYYPRFGFLPAADFHILPPWGEPTPALMALPLTVNGLAEARGKVVYPPAFDGQ